MPQERVVLEPVVLNDQKWADEKLYCSVSFGNAFTIKGCVVSRTETGIVLDFPKYRQTDGTTSFLTILHKSLFMKAVSVALSCYDTLAAVLSKRTKGEDNDSEQ